MLLISCIALAGYLLGSIPTGFLVAKSRGIDIRRHGSGNIGATNVFRTLGKKWGVFVFLCDALKGIAGATAGAWMARHAAPPIAGAAHGCCLSFAVAGIAGGIACILGHNFPIWLKFKGGKGVATSLGVVIGLAPLAAAVASTIWAIVLFVSRYVSLASILGAVAVPVTVAFTARGADKAPLLVFTSLAALLIVIRHRTNIQRLLTGTESRFGKPKPKS